MAGAGRGKPVPNSNGPHAGWPLLFYGMRRGIVGRGYSGAG